MNYRSALALVMILLLGFGLRVHNLADQSYWWDEIATVNRATIPLGDMLSSLLAKANQLPLYYLLTRPWSQLGTSEFIMRFLSVVWGTLAIALLYRVGRLAGGRQVGLIAAFFLAISPFHIWYSQEARMYTLLVASVIAAHWFLLRILNEDKALNWVGYGLCLFVAVYTHYFASLLLITHYVFFAFHFRRTGLPLRKWFVSAALMALPLAAWGGLLVNHGRERLAVPPWIPATKIDEPIYTLIAFTVGSTIEPTRPATFVVLCLFLMGIAICLLRVARQQLSGPESQIEIRRILSARLIFLWLVVPVFLTYLISIPWPLPQKPQFSIYVDRYLIVALPALLLLAAWGFELLSLRPPGRWLATLGLVTIGILTLPSLRSLYTDPVYARENWRQALTKLEHDLQPKDVVFGRRDHGLPFSYYAGGRFGFQELPPAASSAAEIAVFETVMGDIVSEATLDAERAWLVTLFGNYDPHGFPHPRNAAVANPDEHSPQYAWMEERFDRLGEWTFTGIRLTLYDLSSPG